MAGYSTSNQPRLIGGSMNAAPRMWMYSSVDAASVVRVSGYFTDGYKLGMRDGDLIFVFCTASYVWSSHTVKVSGTTVDLTDATTIGSGTSSD